MGAGPFSRGRPREPSAFGERPSATWPSAARPIIYTSKNLFSILDLFSHNVPIFIAGVDPEDGFLPPWLFTLDPCPF